MRLLIVVALATMGCDELFGVDHITPIDAPDAPPPCMRSEPFGTDCRTLVLPLLADTYLDAANPDRVNGNRDALLITDVTAGIFKFDITGIAVGERIAGASFTIRSHNGENALSCSASQTVCATCTTTIERWSLYWMTPAWTQAAATFNTRGDAAWALPGAASMPQDRSPLLASGPRPTTTKPMVLSLTQDQLLANPPECYAVPPDLALLMHIEGGGGWFSSGESNPCNTLELAPALELTLCR